MIAEIVKIMEKLMFIIRTGVNVGSIMIWAFLLWYGDEILMFGKLSEIQRFFFTAILIIFIARVTDSIGELFLGIVRLTKKQIRQNKIDSFNDGYRKGKANHQS